MYFSIQTSRQLAWDTGCCINLCCSATGCNISRDSDKYIRLHSCKTNHCTELYHKTAARSSALCCIRTSTLCKNHCVLTMAEADKSLFCLLDSQDQPPLPALGLLLSRLTKRSATVSEFPLPALSEVSQPGCRQLPLGEMAYNDTSFSTYTPLHKRQKWKMACNMAYLKQGEGKWVTQMIHWGQQNSTVVSIQVHTGDKVELGVHPVEASAR